MSISEKLRRFVNQALRENYEIKPKKKDISISRTKPEFKGDYSVTLFKLSKQLSQSPAIIGEKIGTSILSKHQDIIQEFDIQKGFLNIVIKNNFWIGFANKNYSQKNYFKKKTRKKKIIVEYSSPNTNKPLHVGHLRNNFLGWSLAEILKANGDDIIKTCVVNDRGIHICKSMRAWFDYGNGETPESTNTKGDHFVGKYYVKCEEIIKAQASALMNDILRGDIYYIQDAVARNEVSNLLQKLRNYQGENNNTKENETLDKLKEIVRSNTQYMLIIKEWLLKWEKNDPQIIGIWEKMNSWVYKGFEETYKRIGSDFDVTYYESNTYLLGRESVKEALEKGVFIKKKDGSVWANLRRNKLDEKIVLRKDGTSVYMTQDLGLAQQKYERFHYDQSIYVIGDEQNYHMKALKVILKKMKKPYAKGVHHLSYGMVELPSGRMKSREGTVVDADDLINEVVNISAKHTEELGKVKDFTSTELEDLYEIIGLGALKFFLLRVDPKKKMLFNPEESIDFHGFTGPFIQYTYARIKSILRKNSGIFYLQLPSNDLLKLEKDLIIYLEQYQATVKQAGREHNPSLIAIYVFHLAQLFNTFYTAHSVINAESEEKRQLRLQLSEMTANVIASSMGLLGIKVPERM